MFRRAAAITSLTFILLFSALSLALAGPTFTGDVPADFTAPDTIVINDPGMVGDVGLPAAAPPGTISGWDMRAIYFDYDHSTDRMYVGINCEVICGDADGSGDPAVTSPWLSSDGGNDRADLSGTESFSVLLDLDNDYPTATNGYEVVVGVSSTSDLSSFGAYNFTGSASTPSIGYGTPLANNVALFASPAAGQPDIEFYIDNFSTLPDATFLPGESFIFQTYVFAGSLEDGGIGEDYVPSQAGRVSVVVPGGSELGNYVWEDLNGDGIQDAGEPGVPGVTVNLLDGTGTMLTTTTTDAGGLYLFDVLDAGDYAVEFVLPMGWSFTQQDQGADDTVDSDADMTTGRTITTTLDQGESDLTWDAGVIQTATVGDFVWEDVDVDGVQDVGEPGVPGVTVNLLDDTGATIATTTTDAAGLYLFTSVMPGTYSVEFTGLPAAYTFTLQNQAGDDTLDSDADTTTGQTAQFPIQSGDDDRTWDAGLYQPAALGDFVWEDLDQDGIQDAGEPGVAGVTVNLYDATTMANIATDTTDASGLYFFPTLAPGDYMVEFIVPTGYTLSPQDQGGDDTLDSDADATTGRTTTIALAAGETDPTWDAGIYLIPTAVELASLDSLPQGGSALPLLALAGLTLVAGLALGWRKRRA